MKYRIKVWLKKKERNQDVDVLSRLNEGELATHKTLTDRLAPAASDAVAGLLTSTS